MYKFLGFGFVGLAFLGIILPVLPATPFLLLAAGCFSKSSTKWHNWLLNNRMFGPLLRNWQDHKSLTLKTKIIALSSILISAVLTLTLSTSNIYIKVAIAMLITFGFVFVCRIPVIKNK